MSTDIIKWIEIYYKVLDTINCQQINYWVYRGWAVLSTRNRAVHGVDCERSGNDLAFFLRRRHPPRFRRH